jgi:hypothetical protein
VRSSLSFIQGKEKNISRLNCAVSSIWRLNLINSKNNQTKIDLFYRWDWEARAEMRFGGFCGILGALVKRAYVFFPLDPLAHEVESRPTSSSYRNISRELFRDADSGMRRDGDDEFLHYTEGRT